MEHRYRADIDADPSRVFAIVADLTTYPSWLDIVHRVEPDPSAEGEAWFVTLRAALGPLARSKRLRMVLTASEPERHVRFEREEHDGRDHSPWVLDSVVEPAGTGATTITMTLTYGGRLWTSALNGVLDAQVERATVKLRALAA